MLIMRIKLYIIISMLLSGQNPAEAGFILYHVSVNTSPLSGEAGNLDFQFNPGGFGAESATATVTNFLSSGLVTSPAIPTGNVSGSLPSALTLNNTTIYNDLFQGFTYGTNLTFDLTLSGTAIDMPGGPFGSSFALSLYDSAGITPYFPHISRPISPNFPSLGERSGVSGTGDPRSGAAFA